MPKKSTKSKNKSMPVPEIGDFIAVWWSEYRLYYVGTVVDKTVDSIRVAYWDGDWGTENINSLKYKPGATKAISKDSRNEFIDTENNIIYTRNSAGGFCKKPLNPLANLSAVTTNVMPAPTSNAAGIVNPSVPAKSSIDVLSAASSLVFGPTSLTSNSSFSSMQMLSAVAAAERTSNNSNQPTFISTPAYLPSMPSLVLPPVSKLANKSHKSSSSESVSTGSRTTIEDLLEQIGVDPATINVPGSSTSPQLNVEQAKSKDAEKVMPTTNELKQNNSQTNLSKDSSNGNSSDNKRLKIDTNVSSTTTTTSLAVEDPYSLLEQKLAAIKAQEDKLKTERMQLEVQRQEMLKKRATGIEKDYEQASVAIEEFIVASGKLKANIKQLSKSTDAFKNITKSNSIGDFMKSNPMVFSANFKTQRSRHEESHKRLLVEHDDLSSVLKVKSSNSPNFTPSNNDVAKSSHANKQKI